MSTKVTGKEDVKNEVNDVTKKMENLNVDSNQEANDEKGPNRSAPRRGGFRGRGRGRGGRGGRKFTPRVPYDEILKKIEEDQKNKKIVETGVKGYVRWYSVRGRYGFIAREGAPEDSKDDFFVHQTAITKSNTLKVYLRTLDDNEPVVFDVVEGRKGLEAANVTGPDDTNVKGSRFSRQLLARFRFSNFRRGPPRKRENSENGESAGDEEARGKRRPRRVRENNKEAKGEEKPEENGADLKEDKGKGDAPANVEKKGQRRNNKNRGKKEPAGEVEKKGEAQVKA